MFFMHKENLSSFDMGPFRIRLKFDQKNACNGDDLKFTSNENSAFDFSLTFIVDEYVKNKWNYAYSQNQLQEYRLIEKFTRERGFIETAQDLQKIITEGNFGENLN